MEYNRAVTALIVTASLFLTSCDQASDATDSTPTGDRSKVSDYSTDASNQEDPPAFHFASGDLPLGDFDYEEIKDDLFDPCTEISAEEFAKAGARGIADPGVLPAGGGFVCHLRMDKPPFVYNISSSGSSRDLVERDREIFEKDASKEIPDVYLYDGDVPQSHVCVAAVDTQRGQFGVVAGDPHKTVPVEEVCDAATEALEAIYAI